MRRRLKSWARQGLSFGYGTLDALGLYRCTAPPAVYVADRANWVIRWVGDSYVGAIEHARPGTAAVHTDPMGLFRRVVHFGSHFNWGNWLPVLPESNRYAVTIYHGKHEDGPEMAHHVDFFLANHHRVERVVTASTMMEDRLLDWGVPREKLVRVPLGVDTGIFRPPSEDERAAARRRFGIPDGALCIGSFQKDGVGWGEGFEPKLVKGPDVFVEAAGRLAREFPVFVLLTGPARGYVKRGLERQGVPFHHFYAPDNHAVATCYHALDLYLMTSREEGGPLALLESMASGVPLVSTRTGMAEDVIENGRNGALTEVDDIGGLVERAGGLLADSSQADAFRRHGLAVAESHRWDRVAARLYDEVYKPLLAEATLSRNQR